MRVCFASLSRIPDDPRIRRHAQALAEAGWDVCAVGLRGGRGPTPSFPVTEVDLPVEGRAKRLAQLGFNRLVPGRAQEVHWSSPLPRAVYAAVRAFTPDVVVANDWPVLPACARAAESLDAKLVYDSHEYGVGEHVDRWKWRLLYPAYIHALELDGIKTASLVMTVSDGISDLLAADLDLMRPPTVVRNMPAYQRSAFHAAHSPLEVLYQGVFAPDRGLELLLAGAALWGSGATLVLRGLGPEAYVDTLRSAAAALPAGRVRFDPAADPRDLVVSASTSDVGIHPIPGVSAQTRLCLPNKFFEYAMAGLALCVSDVPEMARLLKQHDLGVLIPEATPQGIASTIASLDAEAVEHYKRQSLLAAQVLNWTHESARVVAAFEPLRA